jgi:AcrR family transcriptional regulator
MTRLSLEARRRHFIDAAIQVLANEGVARATTRRIAEVANVPLAGLHYCFKTKEELFEAVVEASMAGGLDWAGRDVEPGIGLHRAVEVMLRGHLVWIHENLSMVQAQFELTHWALRSPAYRHLAQREGRTYVDTTAQLLREARQEHEMRVDIDMLAQHIVALADGYGLQCLWMDNIALGVLMDYAVLALQAAVAAQVAEPATVQTSASG